MSVIIIEEVSVFLLPQTGYEVRRDLFCQRIHGNKVKIAVNVWKVYGKNWRIGVSAVFFCCIFSILSCNVTWHSRNIRILIIDILESVIYFILTGTRAIWHFSVIWQYIKTVITLMRKWQLALLKSQRKNAITSLHSNGTISEQRNWSAIGEIGNGTERLPVDVVIIYLHKTFHSMRCRSGHWYNRKLISSKHCIRYHNRTI